MYSLEILMMGGKTVRNMWSVIPKYCYLLASRQVAVSV
jgi:hypothetical protein